jgi:ParB-like chromosome segregation protein Spo0J
MQNKIGNIQLVPIGELKPNPRNPNTHSEEQIARIAQVIKHQGWRAPIVVSNQSGLVVTGHGRVEAGKLLGLEKVPVSYQDFANDADEKAHLLADNRLSELSELDNTKLKDLIQELDTGEIDLAMTGFNNDEISALMTQYFQGDDLGDDPTAKLEIMKNTQLRQLLLIMKEAEFNEIIDKLEALKEKHGYESNNDCIITLIRNAE